MTPVHRGQWAVVGALLPILAACSAMSHRAAPELRVLVYNIHAGKDAKGVDNLDRVAQLVRDTRADIVLLQEVDVLTRRSGNVDQPARLRERTGFHAAFGKTLDYQGGLYGIAVLSRWPIDSSGVASLPIDPPQLRSGVSYEPRGALRAFITSPHGRIVVMNTHLDASRDDHYRRQEARTIVALADSLRGAGFLLVGGDFNSEAGSAVQQSLTAAPLHDAWALCGQGNGLTYPADSGTKRIDYLYLPPRATCARAEVIPTDASDHRPLLVRVTAP
jgi:endonuclease/exonuclease/phosphatase family metal-dependent hydrolase